MRTGDSEYKTFSDVFNIAFPLYLSYGMTYEQYWQGDPVLCKYYREAHDIRLEEQNAMMHLQGMYVHQAIGDYIEFYAMLSHPKLRKSYPEKPYAITERKKRIDEQEQEEAVANYYINLFKKQELAEKEIVGEDIQCQTELPPTN